MMSRREKRIDVFYHIIEGRYLRLYRCKDVCQEVIHPNRETTDHIILLIFVSTDANSRNRLRWSSVFIFFCKILERGMIAVFLLTNHILIFLSLSLL